MTKEAKQRLSTLRTVQNRGFDQSYVNEDKHIRVKCSQCEAMVINGIACHEAGCPNAPHSSRRRYGG